MCCSTGLPLLQGMPQTHSSFFILFCFVYCVMSERRDGEFGATSLVLLVGIYSINVEGVFGWRDMSMVRCNFIILCLSIIMFIRSGQLQLYIICKIALIHLLLTPPTFSYTNFNISSGTIHLKRDEKEYFIVFCEDDYFYRILSIL